jgi:hypothetical protein
MVRQRTAEPKGAEFEASKATAVTTGPFFRFSSSFSLSFRSCSDFFFNTLSYLMKGSSFFLLFIDFSLILAFFLSSLLHLLLLLLEEIKRSFFLIDESFRFFLFHDLASFRLFHETITIAIVQVLPPSPSSCSSI